MKETEHWEDYFDGQFDEPDPWAYETSEYEQTKYRRQIEMADDYLEQPDRILEIGCSEGVHSSMLLDAFPSANLLGISLSEREIERARERIETERATFVAADATEYLHDLTGEFDLVVWSETMYYMGDIVSVPEMYDLVETVGDHLTDGGVIVSTNIVGQEDTSESRLTRPAILSAYRTFFESVCEPVRFAAHEEWKEESGRSHEYEIWGYKKPQN